MNMNMNYDDVEHMHEEIAHVLLNTKHCMYIQAKNDASGKNFVAHYYYPYMQKENAVVKSLIYTDDYDGELVESTLSTVNKRLKEFYDEGGYTKLSYVYEPMKNGNRYILSYDVYIGVKDKIKGHRTRAPSKKPVVKLNVRAMF